MRDWPLIERSMKLPCRPLHEGQLAWRDSAGRSRQRTFKHCGAEETTAEKKVRFPRVCTEGAGHLSQNPVTRAPTTFPLELSMSRSLTPLAIAAIATLV